MFEIQQLQHNFQCIMTNSLKGRIILFILIIFLAQSCLDPAQTQGKCSKCPSTQNLDSGSCYVKIRGCLKQSTTICKQCQQGYVLSQNLCIREAEYNNSTNLAPSTVKIQQSKISSSQITPVLAGGFQETTNFNSPLYILARTTLYKEYSVLSNYKIYKVEQQIVNGQNYMFYIINQQNYDLYLAKVYVSFQLVGSVSEIFKNDASILKGSMPVQGPQPLPGMWRAFTSISDPRYDQSLNLIKKTEQGIQNYKLQKVEYQVVAGINFLFYYKGPDGQSYTIHVYKPFYGPALIKNRWGVLIKPSPVKDQSPLPIAGASEVMSASDYEKEPFLSVIKVIQKVFPQFSSSSIKKVQRQIVAGWNLVVTFSLSNSTDVYDMQVFVPLSYTGNPPQIQAIKKNGVTYILPSQNQQTATTVPFLTPQTTNSISPIVGGYTDVTNFNSPFYIQANSVLLREYPQLSPLTVLKSQEQIVNGVNYIFYFSDQQSGNQYLAQVYVDLSLGVTLNKVFMNDQSIKGGETGTIGSQTPKRGEWQEFKDMTDERVVDARELVEKSFEGLSQYQLAAVESQLVAGTNFRLFYVDEQGKQNFTAQIYDPFNGNPHITALWGNIPTPHTYVSSEATTNSSASSQAPFMTGGISSTAVNESNPFFIEAKKTLLDNYPELSSFQIKQIQSQVVSGMNYIFTVVDGGNNDTYVARVYVNLREHASVEEIAKNGVSIKKEETKKQGKDEPISTSISSSNQASTPISTSDSKTASNSAPTSTEKPTTTSSVDDLIAGGWREVSALQYTYEPFLSVASTITKVFQTFSSELVIKVAKQVVAGWNYMVAFNLPNSIDLYEIKVFVPLAYTGNMPQITDATKNGITFTITPTKIETVYSYQSDPIFTELYKFFKSEVNISNLLPIAEVNREEKSLTNSSVKFLEYRITFSSDEYAICRFYPQFGVYEVISFMADKTEIYHLAGKLGVTLTQRTEGVLTQKTKTYDAKKFNRVLVKDITQVKLSDYNKVYRINAFSYSGHFNITILDKGEMFVIQAPMIDSKTCFAIRTNTTIQYRQEYVIDQIKTFLFSKYALSGYEVTLAAVNAVDNATNQYVMLLARDDLKKLKVSIEETNGTFAIKKQELLNGALYVVTDTKQQTFIDQAAKKIFSKELTGLDKVLFLTNGTVNIAKYANTTTLLTFAENTQTQLKIVQSKEFGSPIQCETFQSDSSKTCLKCPQTGFLWKERCYSKIVNCAFQVGSECLSCDKYSIDKNGKCIKDCVEIFV